MLAWNCVSGRSNVKSTWSRSRTPDLSQKRCLRGQVVPDRGRGDTAFAHGVADLIQAQHDIASSIETRNIGPPMRVDRQAAILGAVRPDLARKLRADPRSKGGVDAVQHKRTGPQIEQNR